MLGVGFMNNTGNDNSAIIPSVSPKVAQALYNEITGKTENYHFSRQKSKLIRKTDIVDLCQKIDQFSSQYD
jgi:hypothetical protein